MIGWLYRLIIGDFQSCQHKWVILEKQQVSMLDAVWTRYTLQCEKCGNLKVEDAD